MSHRLEKNTDTKYHGYKEPKTSRRRSTADYKSRYGQQANTGKPVPEDAETTWNLARESETGKGSLADKGTSVENILKHEKARD